MEIYYINDFVDILDPNLEMLGPIKSGTLVTSTVPPGCWGPMITPSIRSGHEVTKPIAIENAVPGDAIAIKVESIEIKSLYTSSGFGESIKGRFVNDPTIDAICPNCNIKNPSTYIEGIGNDSIKCELCSESILPQTIKNGYTLVFDEKKSIGISVPQEIATDIAKKVKDNNSLPLKSKQHPVNVLAKADIKNMVTRIKPMIGNIGSLPKAPVPSSRNAGDSLKSLMGSKEFMHVKKDDLTDAHMDINTVVEGSIIIVPVKVNGGGIYFGDVHSVQGNGELAGHTADVTAEVTIRLELIKDLAITGPIIIPPSNALNDIYKPITDEEYQDSQQLASKYNFIIEERSFPLQFVGSAENLNQAIDNAIKRAEISTGLHRNELVNRGTVTGSVDIGRTSGVVYLTMMIPESTINKMKLINYVMNQYNNG